MFSAKVLTHFWRWFSEIKETLILIAFVLTRKVIKHQNCFLKKFHLKKKKKLKMVKIIKNMQKIN